jgi:tRNA-2-methylthio-N6-dimethylallyladenosine synthase
LSSDFIVGFPTETEEDFRATYGLVKDVRFDSAFIFKYSVRPHTKAAELPDDVPQAAKKRRHAELLELQKNISQSLKKHAQKA